MLQQVAKSYSGFYIVVLVLIANFILTSCVGDKVGTFVIEEQDVAMQMSDGQKSGKQKFAAWSSEDLPESSDGSRRAVKALLSQVDVFILYNSLELASGKLERLLRIVPTYAPAWSRLSWIALQSHSPERAKQMALRSNSYAQGNNKLKILNWSFIRQASQQMNDAEEVRRAERMIETLEVD